MNGQAVEFNKRALALGRLAAHDPAAVDAAARAAAPATTPRIPAAQTLDALVHRRAEYLIEYQDAAYAERYTRLVQSVRDAERDARTGSEGLAEAVARNYFKLLAYKDEYEVARLHSSAGVPAADRARRSRATTSCGSTSRRRCSRGPIRARARSHKREFGPWMLGAFRVLARMKGLRGTALDPFGTAGGPQARTPADRRIRGAGRARS